MPDEPELIGLERLAMEHVLVRGEATVRDSPPPAAACARRNRGASR